MAIYIGRSDPKTGRHWRHCWWQQDAVPSEQHEGGLLPIWLARARPDLGHDVEVETLAEELLHNLGWTKFDGLWICPAHSVLIEGANT